MAEAPDGPGRDRDEALAALATGRAPDPDEVFDQGDDTNAKQPGADPPAPAEPTPTEPTPAEPTPAEPTPTEPTPAEPTAAEPTAVEVASPAPRPVVRVTRSVVPQRRVMIRTQHLSATPAPRRPMKPWKPYKPGRRAGVGLPLLVVLSLLALFVAWVSAEPFWLAVGHDDAGRVQVTRCDGRGDLGARCVGAFTATGKRYTVQLAAVTGAAPQQRTVGETLPARMVSEDGRIAYAGDATGLHLRWLTGLALLLLIGLGIAWATGAWQFRASPRFAAVLTSLLTPLLLAAVTLALTY